MLVRAVTGHSGEALRAHQQTWANVSDVLHMAPTAELDRLAESIWTGVALDELLAELTEGGSLAGATRGDACPVPRRFGRAEYVVLQRHV